MAKRRTKRTGYSEARSLIDRGESYIDAEIVRLLLTEYDLLESQYAALDEALNSWDSDHTK